MISYKKHTKGICLVALLLATVMLFTSCLTVKPSSKNDGQLKDDILTRIEASESQAPKAYSYIQKYFVDWKLPEFNENKLIWAEQVFNTYYNYEGGLPNGNEKVLERAAAVARLFLTELYDEIDIEDEEQVTDGLINALVAYSGDPYGVYRPPEDASDYNTDMSGKFGGIGVVVEYDHQAETIMVSEVLMGSPAESAGVKVGDYIRKVDGKTIEELGYLNAVSHVRGEIGTDVVLTVLRDGAEVEFTITRAEVEENTVAYEIIDGKYGYIRVASFKGNTDEQFADAIDAIRDANVEGVIFDMRNNLGGYVDSVVNMLSYILPTGKTVISYTYKTIPTETRYTVDDGIDPETDEPIDSVLDIPMIVLCNEYTASAAEIFTAALRDYTKDGLVNARSVGTTTYKKGVMQAGIPYSDKSSITLTVAYYNPPSGINYHGIGITPDVISELTSDVDTQLEDGIEELKKLLN